MLTRRLTFLLSARISFISNTQRVERSIATNLFCAVVRSGCSWNPFPSLITRQPDAVSGALFTKCPMTNWSFVFFQWFRRDLAGRYRGSWLGLAWPVIQPLAQVLVFTLIFHGFMQIKWPVRETVPLADVAVNNADWLYGANVLAGMSVFNFFAEILGRAPSVVLSQPNLVLKVKFPLVVLPAVTASSALVHILVGAGITCMASLWFGTASVHLLWLPLWLLPVVLYGLGIACLLACLGVYVRDLVQAMPAVTSLLMFLSPIFYPLSSVSSGLQKFFLFNPLSWAIESLRSILFSAEPMDLAAWGFHLFFSLICIGVAYAVFHRLKSGFSDVL